MLAAGISVRRYGSAVCCSSSWYRCAFIVACSLTNGPTPCALIQPQTMMEPPPPVAVGCSAKGRSFSSRVLLSRCQPSQFSLLTLLSSENKTWLHWSTVTFCRRVAHRLRTCRFRTLTSGFFVAGQLSSPNSRILLRTVRDDTRSCGSRLRTSFDDLRRSASWERWINRSSRAVVAQGRPERGLLSVLLVSLKRCIVFVTVDGEICSARAIARTPSPRCRR